MDRQTQKDDSLLKDSKFDPYDVCPTHESLSFILRLVSQDDAEDLYKCYTSGEAFFQH